MENIAEFQDESIGDNLRTRRKPYLIHMGTFKYQHKIIAQNCNPPSINSWILKSVFKKYDHDFQVVFYVR